VARRLALALTFTLVAGVLTLSAQQPAASSDLKTSIGRLGAFDYAVRMNAARTIRRVPAAQAVPALIEAVRTHSDQFVRYRALVLLTAFNDRGTPDLLRGLMRDRNDRIREVVYRWFAARPDPAMVPTLLAALQTEQAEFVRPALVSAVAALGSDPQVQRALIAEAGRGLDFFRIAVIEALGERKAAYAANTIAELATVDGPLQDDAVLALARIGDARALTVIPAGSKASAEVAAALQAAGCFVGTDCAARLKALVEIAASPRSTPQAAQAAVTALGAVAAKPDADATRALFDLAGTVPAGLREAAAVAFSVVAVRVPDHLLKWYADADDATRQATAKLLKDGFERLEEDYAEEQFFAAARAGYWAASEGSPSRTHIAALIDALEF
jgi:hypothetical protein